MDYVYVLVDADAYEYWRVLGVYSSLDKIEEACKKAEKSDNRFGNFYVFRRFINEDPIGFCDTDEWLYENDLWRKKHVST